MHLYSIYICSVYCTCAFLRKNGGQCRFLWMTKLIIKHISKLWLPALSPPVLPPFWESIQNICTIVCVFPSFSCCLKIRMQRNDVFFSLKHSCWLENHRASMHNLHNYKDVWYHKLAISFNRQIFTPLQVFPRERERGRERFVTTTASNTWA